jgi:hypothetical protein
MWSEIEYKGYKAMSKNTDWSYLIRQKVNNLYTRYFDEEVILKKDYMKLLSTPKKLYLQWVDGAEMDAESITTAIDDALDEAIKLKEKYQKQKMTLSWSEYKKIVEGFFKRCFDSCKLIEDYEKEVNYFGIYDFINEDNFYIKYICKSLEGELKKYEKRYNNLPQNSRKGYKRCQLCGCLIEVTGKNHKYCSNCKRSKQLEWQRNSMRKKRCEVL